MICDFLDGKIARLLNAMSKFGAMFDTLADFVAFGVVPGFLAFKSSLFQINILGFLVVIFYIFAGGYRLVRFTLSNTNPSQKQPFIGLPIPTAAGTISSFIIVNYYLWHQVKSPDIFLAVVFVASVLMISKIEYLPLEKGQKLTKETKMFLSLGFLSIIAAIWYPYLVFVGWISIYIFYGIIRHFIISAKKK
jgi:CDP-diacylglycerol--serine O-phosphatidyltransferase